MHDALEVTLHFVDLHLLQTVGSRDGNHLKHFRHRAWVLSISVRKARLRSEIGFLK